MNEVIQGWRVGAVYKSESGELFTIHTIHAADSQLLASGIKKLLHHFTIDGNSLCNGSCEHGNLTNLVDTNTTTYKIRGKE